MLWVNQSLLICIKIRIEIYIFYIQEIRNLGVGNFKFSTDEAEREKQMEFFKSLKSQVIT